MTGKYMHSIELHVSSLSVTILNTV